MICPVTRLHDTKQGEKKEEKREKMNIQIFGSKKCFDTQKAERYFKERKTQYQYVDILRFGLSKGELKSVSTAVGIANLINPRIQKSNFSTMSMTATSSWEEKLLTNPKLFKTPIVRNGKKATVGYRPEIWADWD